MNTNAVIKNESIIRQGFSQIKPGLGDSIDPITSELTLQEVGIDSVDFFELVGFVEDRLDIQLPNESLSGLKTIGDFDRVIEENK